MFQSLIGRMATLEVAGFRGREGEFQSLIGRMATNALFQPSWFRVWFQSLIGRMATKDVSLIIEAFNKVSIPHR